MLLLLVLTIVTASPPSTLLNIHGTGVSHNMSAIDAVVSAVSKKHPAFLREEPMIPGVKLYATPFLDSLRVPLLRSSAARCLTRRLAQALSNTPQCTVTGSTVVSKSGQVKLVLNATDCLSTLESAVVKAASAYRNPNYISPDCLAESLATCQAYGEADVLDRWEPTSSTAAPHTQRLPRLRLRPIRGARLVLGRPHVRRRRRRRRIRRRHPGAPCLPSASKRGNSRRVIQFRLSVRHSSLAFFFLLFQKSCPIFNASEAAGVCVFWKSSGPKNAIHRVPHPS